MGSAYPLELGNMLIDTFNTFGLIQIVDLPTRGYNINLLDIFATDRPGLIQKVEVIPGLSDHEVVIIASSLATTIIKSSPRTKLLWHQADLQSLNERIKCFSSKFRSYYSVDTQIQDLWNI